MVAARIGREMEEDFLPQGVGGVDLALGPYFKGNGSLGKFDGLLEEGKGGWIDSGIYEWGGGAQYPYRLHVGELVLLVTP